MQKLKDHSEFPKSKLNIVCHSWMSAKRRRKYSKEQKAYICDQCQIKPSLDQWTTCGDCQKNLCHSCADLFRCDLCFAHSKADETSHYPLCEACIVHCESCAGLSLCRFCKPDHLKGCDIRIWIKTTLQTASWEIEQRTKEIDSIHYSIKELHCELRESEEALTHANELKQEAEEVAASLGEDNYYTSNEWDETAVAEARA